MISTTDTTQRPASSTSCRGAAFSVQWARPERSAPLIFLSVRRRASNAGSMTSFQQCFLEDTWPSVQDLLGRFGTCEQVLAPLMSNLFTLTTVVCAVSRLQHFDLPKTSTGARRPKIPHVLRPRSRTCNDMFSPHTMFTLCTHFPSFEVGLVMSVFRPHASQQRSCTSRVRLNGRRHEVCILVDCDDSPSVKIPRNANIPKVREVYLARVMETNSNIGWSFAVSLRSATRHGLTSRPPASTLSLPSWVWA